MCLFVCVSECVSVSVCALARVCVCVRTTVHVVYVLGAVYKVRHASLTNFEPPLCHTLSHLSAPP